MDQGMRRVLFVAGLPVRCWMVKTSPGSSGTGEMSCTTGRTGSRNSVNPSIFWGKVPCTFVIKSIRKTLFAFSWSFCGAKNMIDCMDKRLYGIQASPISWLAWTPQNLSGLTGTCHPCCTACIAMHLHASVPSPLHVNFNFPSSHHFIHRCGSYILCRVPHLTTSYP